MPTLALIVTLVVAALHVGFLVLEMFLWTTPAGQRIFGLPAAVMRDSAVLASNQGLYNGFLAAGLVWSTTLVAEALEVRLFFLSCVVVAGVYGGMTAKRSILWMQALPGAMAIALTLASR